ncbi:hypothetical protein ACIBCA_01280 [Kitasatospora sp. NPDC051170]|uniref:hypothetical protein n=1 Tax=Kitasatospora sp. NPDC051170 TaxID=3364056 RepID=UPI0037AEE3B4
MSSESEDPRQEAVSGGARPEDATEAEEGVEEKAEQGGSADRGSQGSPSSERRRTRIIEWLSSIVGSAIVSGIPILLSWKASIGVHPASGFQVDWRWLVIAAGLIAFLIYAAAAGNPFGFLGGRLSEAIGNYSIVSVLSVSSLVLTGVACALVALSNRFFAGVVLIFFAFLRCCARIIFDGPVVWPSRLASHLRMEVFLHMVMIIALAMGSCLMISGIPRPGFTFASRVAICGTIMLAALVAINKVASRARKVCTEIVREADCVMAGVPGIKAHLEAPDPAVPNDRRHELSAAIDRLDLALGTRISTGFKRLGAEVIHPDKKDDLVLRLKDIAQGVLAGGDLRTVAQVRGIRAACEPWVDVSL